jgi:hypothetical protein
VVASAVQLLAGGTVLLLVALSLGELDPTRWSDVSWTSAGAAVFLLVFDSLLGFVLYTRAPIGKRADAAGQYLRLRHAACRRRDRRDRASRGALGRRVCRRGLRARRGRTRAARADEAKTVAVGRPCRAGAHITDVNAADLSLISKPSVVTRVILEAVQATG